MNKLGRAICFATERFDGKWRKGEKCSAIFHSLEAAAITQTICEDEEVACAAVLHDTVEDTDVTLSEIEKQFGKRVAFLVASETEEKYPEKNPSETWLIRKERTLEVLKQSTDVGIRALWLGDKLSNMRSLSRMKERMGSEMWNMFHQKDPKAHEKYYCTIAKELAVFSGTQAYSELQDLINKVFEEN